MNAQLIESPNEHHWVLLDHTITQMVVDRNSVRLQTWSLDGSADLHFSAPLTLQMPSGASRSLDPSVPETLAPILALVGVGVRSLTITRDGQLTVALADGSSLEAVAQLRTDAWEVQGGGLLEGMSYSANRELQIESGEPG